MSTEEEMKNKVIVFDDGDWQAKTLAKEITTFHKNAEIVNTVQLEKGSEIVLQKYLDAVAKPENIETDDLGNVTNPVTLFMPFDYEEMHKYNIRDQYNAIASKYPWFRVHFILESCDAAYLHEISRKCGVNPLKSYLNEKGESVNPPEETKQPEPLASEIVEAIQEGQDEAENVGKKREKKKVG